MEEKCTLNEVNEQVRSLCYQILHKFYPTRWSNDNQVVYTLVDTWESAIRAYQWKNPSLDSEKTKIKLPFGSVTRGPNITEVLGNSGINRALQSLFYDTEDSADSKILHAVGVGLTYSLKVYDRRMFHIEYLIDQMYLHLSDEGQLFSYTSPSLGNETSYFHVNFAPPFISDPADLDKIERGIGSIIGFQLDMEVSAIIGTFIQGKKILTSIADIFVDNIALDTITVRDTDV